MQVAALTENILIVEDDIGWQKTLVRLLGPIRANPVSAFDYPDALNKIKRQRHLLIMAIVDLSLPASGTPDGGYYGLEVLDALYENGIYAIVLSGHTHDNARLLAERPEVCEVVDKLHFVDSDFEEAFISKVTHVLQYAAAARQAEGNAPEQQQRLRELLRYH
jgi:CheY-like chemotaxis protein